MELTLREDSPLFWADAIGQPMTRPEITELPTGGVAKVRAVAQEATIAIAVEAVGPRARLRPEVLAGLRGEPLGDGLHGHWVQAYYVHLFMGDAGGRVFADVAEEKVTFAATVPA